MGMYFSGAYSACLSFKTHIVSINADTGKVDLLLNVVERVSGGFSAGGGISSG